MDALVTNGFVILGGPLADERRVVLVVETDNEPTVSEPWTVRLDSRTSRSTS